MISSKRLYVGTEGNNEQRPEMSKFRKNPVVIEAVRVPDDKRDMRAWRALMLFMPDWKTQSWSGGNMTGTIVIKTLQGEMTAKPGDWIIKGVKGEFYPCKPDIFAATYEPVEAEE